MYRMKNIAITRVQHKKLAPYFNFYLKLVKNIIIPTCFGIICIPGIGLIQYTNGQ